MDIFHKGEQVFLEFNPVCILIAILPTVQFNILTSHEFSYKLFSRKFSTQIPHIVIPIWNVEHCALEK